MMRSKLFLVMRGLMGGFIISLVNGFSLPVLFELFVLVSSLLKTGHWYGPIAVAELWFIQFVFGFGCSLLPNVIIAITLSTWLGLVSLRRMQMGHGLIGVGTVMGIVAATWYVLLLFYLEPVMNLRDHSMLAAFILIEEIGIYSWVASHWGRCGVIRG